YIEELAPTGVLGSLERAGLVTISNAQVRLAHPLHGEVVRGAMPKLRVRKILLEEAERLEAASPASGPAALQIAVCRPHAGRRPGPAPPGPGAQPARYPPAVPAGRP